RERSAIISIRRSKRSPKGYAALTHPTHFIHLLRQPERLQRLAVVLLVRLHELREASRVQIDHVEAAPVHELLELRAVPGLLDRGLVLRGNLLRQALGRRKAAPHTLVPLVTRRMWQQASLCEGKP